MQRLAAQLFMNYPNNGTFGVCEKSLSVALTTGTCLKIDSRLVPEKRFFEFPGAVHSVVFAGFSAESLGDRLIDSKSKVLLTATGVLRGTKLVALKQIVRPILIVWLLCNFT
jgi:hypothetical protein